MNKKKLALAVTSAAMIMAVTIGGTLAFFTDTAEQVNVITMGNVQIELEEEMENPANPTGPQIPFVDPTGIMPGDVVSKIPYVTNISESNAAYIRVLIEITNPAGAGDELLTIANLDVDQTKWDIVPVAGAEGQWYCYYKQVLLAGEDNTADPVFTEVRIPEKWNNNVADQSFNIKVTAEAIQADNFEPRTDGEGKITGWFYADGSAIDAMSYTAPSPSTDTE